MNSKIDDQLTISLNALTSSYKRLDEKKEKERIDNAIEKGIEAILNGAKYTKAF